MAACTPGAYLITIRTACLCSMALHHAAALSFSYNYSKPGDLDRANLTYINDSSNSDDRVSLTPEAMTSQSTGRVAYPRPVRLWDHRTGKVASFTTNFSFAIINGGGGGAYITNGTTTGGGANITNSRGDGMAFCVGPFPASLPSDSLGGFLGLFNNYSNVSSPPSPSSSPPRTVGVEFDTFKNPSIDPPDVTADHIGIDINSISSASYTKLPNLALSGTMSASITYNGGSKVMSVSLWLADGDLYTVEARVDLRDAGVPRDAAVGFSAATGRLVESHQLLSWSFTSTDPSKIEPWVIILMAVASASLAGLVAALLCTIMPRQHKPPPTEKIELQVAREFSYDDLSDATNNFSHERRLGAGAFGEVYKGLLPKEKRSFVAKAFMTKSMRDHLRTRPIAVKRLKEVMMERARHDYVTEIMTLGQLSHRNLVKLVGWCDGGGRGGADKPLLLVYELVPNKSLDEHLHGSSSERRRLLTWPERYKIILGIGSAIEYLHTGYRNPILHRDIKPSNVMLDDAFEAKLGDFGLVRQVEAGQGSLRGTIMVGSLDYMDPSCITTESATTASDMYSFGVLLLEIATGKRPRVLKLQQRDGGEEAALGGLPNFLVKAVRESYGKGAVLEMADARLSGEFDESQMERVLLVGLLCVQQDRRSRPAIRDAVNLLTNLRHPVPEVIGV